MEVIWLLHERTHKMDINGLLTVEAHEAGAECNILSPVDYKPTDVFISVMGSDSKVWRSAKKDQTNKIIAARAAKKDIDYDALDIEALCKVTTAWRGITADGKEYECSDKNKKHLFENSPYIVNQLLEFIAKNENFIKG